MSQTIQVTVNGTAHEAAVEPRTLLVDFLRETLGTDGHARGMRHQPVWCLQRPRGRCVRQVVHGICCPGGRPRGNHDRRDGKRRAASAAGGFSGGARPAVRVLHAGHDYGGGGSSGARILAKRRRNQACAGRQLLPVHGLSQHCSRNPARGGRNLAVRAWKSTGFHIHPHVRRNVRLYREVRQAR